MANLAEDLSVLVSKALGGANRVGCFRALDVLRHDYLSKRSGSVVENFTPRRLPPSTSFCGLTCCSVDGTPANTQVCSRRSRCGRGRERTNPARAWPNPLHPDNTRSPRRSSATKSHAYIPDASCAAVRYADMSARWAGSVRCRELPCAASIPMPGKAASAELSPESRVGPETETADAGVSLRCAPGRASRAVGNDTAVANGAEPPARHGPARSRGADAGAPASRPSGRESLT